MPSAQRANDGALLYLSDLLTRDVYVYSYPQAKLLSTIDGMGQPKSECADSAGNIWIADVQAEQVVEYAHGASQPTVSLSTFGTPRGCSVNPKNGDLAISGGVEGTVLSIYHHGKRGWRDPQRYSDAYLGAGQFCGYDATGNLFIDGARKDRVFRLAELPRGAAKLVNLSVTQRIVTPGQVQWDGKHLAIGDTGVSPSIVYQFSITGKSATKAGATILDGTTSVRQFWIQGKNLIGPDYGAHAGVWRYPAGGSPTKSIDNVHGYGAAVSLP